jgi:hypothetical protein
VTNGPAVHRVETSLELDQDRAIDLFLIQWHTPRPAGLAGLCGDVSQERVRFLSDFGAWLSQELERQVSMRPCFVLAPELSLPVSADQVVGELLRQLNRPAVFAGGMEFLRWNLYLELLERCSGMPEPNRWRSGGDETLVVNCAAIWVRGLDGNVRRFVQPKRNPSDAEDPLVYRGNDILLFTSANPHNGKRLNFLEAVSKTGTR